mgnify:CR=1 FL=1
MLRARDAGLKVTVHTGEDTPAATVMETILAVNPDRIGHGIHIIEDLAVVAEVAERGIPLEVNPWSNYLTHSVERIEDHPLKRLFDLGLGSLLAILSAPFMLLILLLIKLDSPGPAVYAQERIGLRGKRIRYLKFRTMRLGAEQLLQELLEKDPQRRLEYETHHKLVRDPRVTRVGRLLRKFSLDELPQLYHVLTGDLSLVGPRAYMPNEYAQMGGYAELILQVRPGLTGWWQVMGRHTTTFQQRLQLDEYYLSNWSLWLDIYILLKTAWVVLSGIGA